MNMETSQTQPAPSAFTSFQYETLKSSTSKPSTRLAVLQPGTRESTIRIKLVHRTFADGPKYEALSYTWGRPDVVKNLELNDTTVEVRENLWYALVHLRSATEERALWIDAICINQTDLEERSEQVQLMTHIYSRATKVLVWLGVLSKTEDNREWFGQLCFERVVTGQRQRSSSQFHGDITKETVALTLQPYWCRVWIVQEVGSARNLDIHWGLSMAPEPVTDFVSVVTTWDQFFKEILSPTTGTKNAAINVAQQRNGRHSDNFLLANLMEACQESQCAEPHDKVYAFLGIAHDCEDGIFPVDYTKPLFELYEDVIRFHLKAQKGRETVVQFSQLVHRLLGGSEAMQRDLYKFSVDQKNFRLYRPEVVPVEAKHGILTLVGPSYEDFIAFPEVTRKWKRAISMYPWELPDQGIGYNQPSPESENLAHLRKKNEVLMALLHDLDPSYTSGMAVPKMRVFWDGTPALDEISIISHPPQSVHRHLEEIYCDYGPGKTSSMEDRPRLFATHDGVIGLMPPDTRPGDILLRFHKSDIALICRALTRTSSMFMDRRATIIGHALVVAAAEPPVTLFGSSLFGTEAAFGSGSTFGTSRRGFGKPPLEEDKAMINMDLRLLQLLTE